MTRDMSYPDYYDCYEYHGNTTIELTRRQDGQPGGLTGRRVRPTARREDQVFGFE